MLVSNTVHRNTIHYKVWRWTFQNWLWKKSISEHKSLCQYWQRIIWVGLFTALLHVLYAPIRVVFYSILYQSVRLVFKNDIIAGFVVWLISLWLLSSTGSWAVIPWFFGFLAHAVALCVIIWLICAGIKWLSKETRPGRAVDFLLEKILYGIWLAVKWTCICVFKWILWGSLSLIFFYLPFWGMQIIGRFYTPKEKLRDEKYKLNSGKNQVVLQLLFWLGFLGMPIFAFFGGQSGYVPAPHIVDNPGWSFALMFIGVELLMMIITWIFVIIDNKRYEQEMRYILHPEQRPVKKPSAIKQFSEKAGKSLERNVNPFLDWCKAIIEKACPMITFVD